MSPRRVPSRGVEQIELVAQMTSRDTFFSYLGCSGQESGLNASSLWLFEAHTCHSTLVPGSTELPLRAQVENRANSGNDFWTHFFCLSQV